MSVEKVVAHFREQAMFCQLLGSPFTAQLVTKLGDDVEAGGPIADLVGDWPGNPRADVLSLCLCGALHAAALTKRDPALAAAYPAQNPNWTIEQIWPLARDFVTRERDWIFTFLKFAPQTNETRRSIALLAAFLSFAKTWDGAIDILEIGASAGLNLNWDRFAYRTQNWSWGDASPVTIETDWSGPAPAIGAHLAVRNRAGCDINPLNIRDPDDILRLRAYIWADQADRLERFDGAVALALKTGVTVERADAATWIADKLAARARDAATIVYHSVFLQYPPRETRAAIIAAIESEGARATVVAPLVWARLEPESLLGGPHDSVRMLIDTVTWPGGERRTIGYTDGHVRAVGAVAAV